MYGPQYCLLYGIYMILFLGCSVYLFRSHEVSIFPAVVEVTVYCNVTAQLVSGELEYVHMHQPPSLDRHAMPPSSHPHQIYDVPRSSGAVRPGTKLGSSTKDVHRSSENVDRRSVGSETKRSPTEPGGMQVQRPMPLVGRGPGDELPYAVAGMAMRLPPVGRRTQDSRAQPRRPVDDEYGFIVAGGTQLPEATFI